MPKDNEVDEKVIWTTNKPTAEGAYYIRGFNVCRPAEEQFEALVQVRMHKPNFFASEESAALFCNLHESTSEEEMDNWIPVDELEDDFEWNGPLVSAATVAELRAEVSAICHELDCVNANWQASMAHAKTLRARADAAERRVRELEKLMEAARHAIGDHYAPNDCYATGPLTGDEFLDLVQCPACAFLEQHEALTGADPT